MDLIGRVPGSPCIMTPSDEMASVLMLVAEARRLELAAVARGGAVGEELRRRQGAVQRKWREVRGGVCQMLDEGGTGRGERVLLAARYPFLGLKTAEDVDHSRRAGEAMIADLNRTFVKQHSSGSEATDSPLLAPAEGAAAGPPAKAAWGEDTPAQDGGLGLRSLSSSGEDDLHDETFDDDLLALEVDDDDDDDDDDGGFMRCDTDDMDMTDLSGSCGDMSMQCLPSLNPMFLRAAAAARGGLESPPSSCDSLGDGSSGGGASPCGSPEDAARRALAGAVEDSHAPSSGHSL